VAEARSRLVEVIDPEAALDASAVVASFHVVARIADATGIPLDRDMYERTADLRAQMGLERLEPDRIGWGTRQRVPCRTTSACCSASGPT